MKLSSYILFSIALPTAVQATVTVQLQSGNFADSANVATNGMPYAIVVSTEDSIFSPGLYDSFDISTVAANGGKFLTINGVDTDDWYTFGSSLNNTSAGPPPSFFTGYANQVSTILINADGPQGPDPASPIVPTDGFAVIWFPEGNANQNASYGFFEDAGLLIPSNGGTSNFSSFIGNGLKSADYNIVPEPQTYALIFGLSVLILAQVRRRK